MNRISQYWWGCHTCLACSTTASCEDET